MKSLHFWFAVLLVIGGTLINFNLLRNTGDRNFSGTGSHYVGTGAWHK